MSTRAFEFLNLRMLPPKPRTKGVIEIRGSYYDTVTLTYLKELLEIGNSWIDGFKWAGGIQALHPKQIVKEINSLCHDFDIYVNTGGMVERVIIQGKDAVDSYLKECKELGFDKVEVSSGLAPISLVDKIAIVEKIHEVGLKAKPEIGFMIGAGAGTQIKGYETSRMRSTDEVFEEIDAYLKAGVKLLMFESEGITEDLAGEEWRTDLVKAVTDRFGFEVFMFEASDPAVFKWYLKEFGPEVNLFIHHTQIFEFQAWRTQLWGDPAIWQGKSVRYE